MTGVSRLVGLTERGPYVRLRGDYILRQYPDGTEAWVIATPEPFHYLLRKGCHCGRKFWTREGYLAHFALRHVLEGAG